MASLLDRHTDLIAGVHSCFDRVVLQGTLPEFCHAGAMTTYMYTHKIRIFDYPRFAQPMRDEIRANAERLAQEAGVEIEFVRKLKSFRKGERIKTVLAKRGSQVGLVHIFSAMESCTSYRPWHDKSSHRTSLKPDSGKCLHYYFYFIHDTYGLCYVRVPTWCPFRLQVYLNGHNYVANRLARKDVNHTILDNAFTHLDDFAQAQHIADRLDSRHLHRVLDYFARLYCPIIQRLGLRYHWSLMQVEYATDIVFKRQADLQQIYDTITRTAIHSVKPDQVATFLGRKLTGNFRDELGNDFNTRIEGTRLRHHMGPASIKMYDKFGLILRIETTANDVSFFKHHRKVEQRDGTTVFKLAPLKKSIYSLRDLRKLLLAANLRYLDFISRLDEPSIGMKALDKVTRPVQHEGRNYNGFNFFSRTDQQLFEVLVRGEHNISGMRNKDVRRQMSHLSSSKISRMLKRLRIHGLIKRIGRSYKYYLTRLGRTVALVGLKLRSLYVMPMLAAPVSV